jgi:hypothetical protein
VRTAEDLAAGARAAIAGRLEPPTRPQLDGAALYGLVGDLLLELEPETEADPVGVLLSLLVTFGAAVGPRPHFVAGGSQHPARLNVVLEGSTSRSRKGTAWHLSRSIFLEADPEWTRSRVMSGLASGEGLIHAVRDPDENQPGASDKRLLVVEPEFARVLAVASRDGSTLSAVLRQSWDDGNLGVLTRKDPLRASGAHICVLAHVTGEELIRRLSGIELANGFANRYLFAHVQRARSLPSGGRISPEQLRDMGRRVADALSRARRIGRMSRSPEAEQLWAEIDDGFGDGEDGLLGALTARPEAQTLRLGVAYALLDGSAVIDRLHLLAAHAVWRYCEASAAYIFGERLGDPVADRLREALFAAGGEGLDFTEQRDLFGRHVSAARLEQAREALHRRGEAETSAVETGGRPRMVSRALARKARKARKAVASRASVAYRAGETDERSAREST